MPANRFPFTYFDLGEAHAISSGKHDVDQEFAHDFGAVRLQRIFPPDFGQRRTISMSYLNSCAMM
jgi:hypothetical protein